MPLPLRLFQLTLLLMYVGATTLYADVVVVSNCTQDAVDFSVQSDQALVDSRLLPGDSRPYRTQGKIFLTLGNSRQAIGKQFPTEELLPNAAYCLEDRDGTLRARRLDLGGNERTLKPNPDLNEPTGYVVPVSLWVDDEQAAVRRIWEARLRQRFRRAAGILKTYSGVEFRVAHVGRWLSSDQIHVFRGSLYEFIERVNPAQTLAIGFTGQYSRPEPGGVLRIAGTRNPLARHILVREWQGVTEQQRVELLVHELGHFLGACHSNDEVSAMRAKLGDRRAADARRGNPAIRFDAANTLVMALVGEHLGGLPGQTAPEDGLKQLSLQTRRRLQQIYTQLALENPGDPVATKYLALLQ